MDNRWDAIIVLGCAPKKNNFPSHSLTQRVRKAEELYNRGLVKKIIFTGGPNKTEIPESLIMKEFSNIPLKDVIIEKKALKTTQNALYTGIIAKEENFKSCLVVTSSYHILRSAYIFRKIFPQSIKLKFVKSEERMSLLRWAWLLFREIRFLIRDLGEIQRLGKLLKN
jgi:uncharacterized SAM-binding protein YcdF (DUF218 family)